MITKIGTELVAHKFEKQAFLGTAMRLAGGAIKSGYNAAKNMVAGGWKQGVGGLKQMRNGYGGAAAAAKTGEKAIPAAYQAMFNSGLKDAAKGFGKAALPLAGLGMGAYYGGNALFGDSPQPPQNMYQQAIPG